MKRIAHTERHREVMDKALLLMASCSRSPVQGTNTYVDSARIRFEQTHKPFNLSQPLSPPTLRRSV